jgi:hypothetical protein
MSPITHLLISWSAASSFKIEKKDRILATIAGVSPDIDGIGLGYDLFWKGDGQALEYWSTYHHTLGHNVGFGLLLTFVAFTIASRRWLTSGLVMLCFHLHLLCDILGSKGPDGYQWPIPYLEPFSDVWQLSWTGQWQLNAWQNIAITSVAIIFIFYQAFKRGLSPLEIFSSRANQVLADTVKKRFQG